MSDVVLKRNRVQVDTTEHPRLSDEQKEELRSIFFAISGEDGMIDEEELGLAISAYFDENL
eukprot:CAMPEP_0173410874 /NCGR_PEP_ID=MMETSP1356-20130122/75581_1 /TAXON_ID=77927 ORGANISM="Hemiselmis virescens, Strain PCC157" /NCGR_SAMPLE_ID=MMETSP1356 /ASSEMBLY_ACC=CAM_ASM_000847 /LENGTH=60 /DNA_ID=CAMNT_0014372539 /DNA_START=30 /DNA_END=209 /DNA_ORIENTATION=+